MSPQRMNMVLQQIKGLSLDDAKTQLRFSKKLAAKLILEYIKEQQQSIQNYQRHMARIHCAPAVEQQVPYICIAFSFPILSFHRIFGLHRR